ncbi:tRNA pseudouridine synthase B [Plectosphaerella plurivora]|uniref:tRNA pseudouridine(55) synthase n=1 Tax=Plectosphaerella plurivora TaxID=936078 RepID=A0A9P8VFX2_9PEZI|nr:tRNA pseudouridine synthase B [Plectosphaerella plurivora]
MRLSPALWKMSTEAVLEGVFAISKPLGMSSAQVIRDCQQYFNPSTYFKPLVEAQVDKLRNESQTSYKKRRLAKRSAQVKMGHGGTLDPLATGVLILGIGSGTKSLQSFLDCTKTYETIVLFGAATDSYDRTGRILTKRPYDHITRELVEKEMDNFRGKFEQIPPLYSALKMEGKPLYEYAREGKPIPREIIGREVEVKELELLEWFEPGTHNHRWPTAEAETAEKNLAEQVWRVEKNQANARKLTPEEAAEDDKAVTAHEAMKRQFDVRQDELVRDIPPHKRRKPSKNPALMSGALGQLPASPVPGRGSNLVQTPSADAPLPWTDKGPAAARIRMTVTSGFYVRSFCHDLGQKVGSAGLMAELSRPRQGDFSLGVNCLEYADLSKGEKEWAPKVSKLLAEWQAKHPYPVRTQPAFRTDRNQDFAKAKRPRQVSPSRSNDNGQAESSKRVKAEEQQPESVADKPTEQQSIPASGDEAPQKQAEESGGV